MSFSLWLHQHLASCRVQVVAFGGEINYLPFAVSSFLWEKKTKKTQDDQNVVFFLVCGCYISIATNSSRKWWGFHHKRCPCPLLCSIFGCCSCFVLCFACDPPLCLAQSVSELIPQPLPMLEVAGMRIGSRCFNDYSLSCFWGNSDVVCSFLVATEVCSVLMGKEHRLFNSLCKGTYVSLSVCRCTPKGVTVLNHFF